MAVVSIITIVKDHATGLNETFASLAEQELGAWEMIIVVGASEDSTLESARNISDKDSRVTVIEQSGLGIYGAMNEGLRNAGGEFSWFMNAGDRFANSQVLGAAVGEISRTKVGIIIGGYQIEGGNESQVYSYPKREITKLNFAFNRHGGCHQAMIFQTEVLKRAGGFNPNYSLASDFDLVLKVLELAKGWRVPDIYASIEPGGVADSGIFTVHQQKHVIRKSLFKKANVTLLSFAWTIAAGTKVRLRRFLHHTN